MAKILIIADDLTGAADCGVAFAGCGTEAFVLLGGPGSRAPDLKWKGSAGMLAIDADTRWLAPELAAESVARLVRSYCGPEDESCLLFKKVDSTMRGNVGAELAAGLEAMRARASFSTRPPMLFAPAFPAQGRTTVNGMQMANGRPLDQAGPGRGVRAPCGDLDALLEEAGLSCGLIDLPTIRAGAGVLEVAMQRIANKVDAVICDAETEDDLRAIAQAGMALGPNPVWAGSAGLARHLANAIGLEGIRSAAPSLKWIRAPGPALFVIGSPASVSREQANALAAAPGVARFTFAAMAMPSGGPLPDPRALAVRITERLANREDVIVQLEYADRTAVNQDRELVQSLGRAIRECAPKVGALVATGGETARAILDAWDVQRLSLVGEVEPGVPYSVAECGDRSLRILTKAGGFGTPGTLLHCREFLRKPASNADHDAAAAPIEGRKS